MLQTATVMSWAIFSFWFKLLKTESTHGLVFFQFITWLWPHEKVEQSQKASKIKEEGLNITAKENHSYHINGSFCNNLYTTRRLKVLHSNVSVLKKEIPLQYE